MNDSIQEFKLNKNNVCNFCLHWDEQKNKFLNYDNDQEAKNLEKLKKKLLNLKMINMIVLLD